MIYQKPTKMITGAYTTADADNGYRIICNSASDFTVTLHTATGKYNFDLEVDNIGAGDVTVDEIVIAQNQHAHIGNTGTAWSIVLGGGGSSGAVDSVNEQTGAVVLDASDIGIIDSGGHFTATDTEGALAELFTSVSDGKDLIAAAITDKGGAASGDDTFTELATAISDIPSGTTPSPSTTSTYFTQTADNAQFTSNAPSQTYSTVIS